MLHRATGPKTLSLSHQIAGRMRRTRNHAVSCWSTCCSRAPGFSFPPFNYILKIFKNGLLNRRFPPLYNWEPYHTSSFQIKSQSVRKQEVHMQESGFKSYDELPLFLNAKAVAKVLGVSPSSGYELMHEPGFPVLRVGNRLVVPKEQFIQWGAEHTGGGCK